MKAPTNKDRHYKCEFTLELTPDQHELLINKLHFKPRQLRYWIKSHADSSARAWLSSYLDCVTPSKKGGK